MEPIITKDFREILALNAKEKKLLDITKAILKRQIELENEIEQLKTRSCSVASMSTKKPQSYAQLHSQTLKGEKREKLVNLSKVDLDKILNLSTELIIQRNRKR